MLRLLFGRGRFDRLRQLFADQFVRDGETYLYRRNLRGPAYRVSAAERDKFIDEYVRDSRRFITATIVGTVVVIMGITAISIWLLGSHERAEETLQAALTILLIAVLGMAVARTYSAPARALERRTPVAPALSVTDERKRTFTELTWPRLTQGFIAFMVLPFLFASGGDVFSATNWLGLGIGGVGLMLVTVQAARKWRFERTG